MRFSCWINTATHTLRICNASYFSSETVVLRTRPVLRDTYNACHVEMGDVSKSESHGTEIPKHPVRPSI
jgi:hypothetical protein